MTIKNILDTLEHEYPRGISFDPMTLRLLQQKVEVDDTHIEELKNHMIQLENGRWFSSEMILTEESRLHLFSQANDWLEVYGLFSVEKLFALNQVMLRHVSSVNDVFLLLKMLGFSVEMWSGTAICIFSGGDLEAQLDLVVGQLSQLIDAAGGILPVSEIENALPYLSGSTLKCIRTNFMEDVFLTSVGEISCWSSLNAIALPEDFSEVLASAVATLTELGRSITPSRLEFALSILYGKDFCKEYGIPDNQILQYVCAMNYQGDHNFSSSWFPHRRVRNDGKKERVRSPNTRFADLGIPIGAQLAFVKNKDVLCTVLDGVNKVRYEGKDWAISSLAMYLLNRGSANGFRYFSYEGVTLWARRSQLLN